MRPAGALAAALVPCEELLETWIRASTELPANLAVAQRLARDLPKPLMEPLVLEANRATELV
jgi:hypothetical protein